MSVTVAERLHLADVPFTLSPLNVPCEIVHGAVVPHERREGVLIIGAGLGRQEAPLHDPRYEVWTCNLIAPWVHMAGVRYLRADRWFDLHQHCAQTEDDLRWIAKCPVPIYLPEDLQTASPLAVRYPLAEMEDRYGGYWACTFAYQIALALSEGFTRIGLYGVELAYGTARERTVEWANVAWWAGYAEAKGITLELPAQSRIGRHTHRYGLEYDAEKIATERYLDYLASATDDA